MADKPKTGLPPPPEAPSLVSRLQGFLQQIGRGQPVAQSRITRTPIYQESGLPGAAGYYPSSNTIGVKPEYMEGLNYPVVPHESSHAIFSNANLTPLAGQLVGQVPWQAQAEVNSSPDLYTTLDKATMANEGLGYSIGKEWGTPYVEHVASRIKDPAIAQQLLRLHRNALAAKNPLR